MLSCRHSLTMMPVSSTPAVILAGGRARRMGGVDKALLRLGDRSILSMTLAVLAPQAAPVAISANGDPARFADHGLPVLADDPPGQLGPLAGILAAMNWAASMGAVQVATVPGDTPFLPADLIARLRDAAGQGAAMAAARDRMGGLRLHPVVGLWPVGLRTELRRSLSAGMRRVGDFAQGHDAGLAVWAADPADPFQNVNTPEDLARAIARHTAARHAVSRHEGP